MASSYTKQTDDMWTFRSFHDGLEQYCTLEPHPARFFIERVKGPKSRRKRWVIVSRRPPETWMNRLYAPKVAGPFMSLEGAQAAYLVMRAAGQFDIT